MNSRKKFVPASRNLSQHLQSICVSEHYAPFQFPSRLTTMRGGGNLLCHTDYTEHMSNRFAAGRAQNSGCVIDNLTPHAIVTYLRRVYCIIHSERNHRWRRETTRRSVCVGSLNQSIATAVSEQQHMYIIMMWLSSLTHFTCHSRDRNTGLRHTKIKTYAIDDGTN